jgi:hypothetical protein
MTSAQAIRETDPTRTIRASNSSDLGEESATEGSTSAPGDDSQHNVEVTASSSHDEEHGHIAAVEPAAARQGRGFTTTRLIALAVVLLLIAAGVVVYLVYGRGTSTPRATAAATPASYIVYTNEPLGYRIAYPSAWKQTTDGQGGVVLQAGGQDAVNVREFTLQHAINTSNLSDMQAVTNAVLSTPNAHLTVLASQRVSVGGLPGIYYLYYFPSGGEQGVHGHYFLFNGNRMFTIVVQALPASDFQRLAKTFDAIAQSFAAVRSK